MGKTDASGLQPGDTVPRKRARVIGTQSQVCCRTVSRGWRVIMALRPGHRPGDASVSMLAHPVVDEVLFAGRDGRRCGSQCKAFGRCDVEPFPEAAAEVARIGVSPSIGNGLDLAAGGLRGAQFQQASVKAATGDVVLDSTVCPEPAIERGA